MPYSIEDLISYGYEEKPVEFEDAFIEILNSKLEDAVNDIKLNIAKSLYNEEDGK
jgi:hypothetical protein